MHDLPLSRRQRPKDPQQVNDLWAYIKQFNADGSIEK